MISQEEVNLIMLYKNSNNYESLYKMLFVLNNKYTDNISKWRINYDLANCCYRNSNIKEAKQYIKTAINYMDKVEDEGYENKKAFTIWLCLNIYEDILSDELILEQYEKIKKMLHFLKPDNDIIKEINNDIASVKSRVNKQAI